MHVYKERALAALKGNWGSAVLISLIATIILRQTVQMGCWILNFISARNITESAMESTKLLNILKLNIIDEQHNLIYTFDFKVFIWLLFSFVTFGLIQAYRDLLDEGHTEVGTLFQFKEMFGKGIVLSLLSSLYIFLWLLLLIVPGIIKSFSYAMSAYLMNREPELSPNEALKQSEVLMRGHRLDLFVLIFSFFGWALLGVLSCGIGLLFLYPYMNTAIIAFFDDIYEQRLDDNYISEY